MTKPGVAPDFEPSGDAHEIVRILHALRAGDGGGARPRRAARGLPRRRRAAQKGRGPLRLRLPPARPEGPRRAPLLDRVPRHPAARPSRRDPDWLPAEFDALDDALVDQVLCDFSVFQSLMDHWALGQRFPIMPLQRLGEEADVPKPPRRHHVRLGRQGGPLHLARRRQARARAARYRRPARRTASASSSSARTRTSSATRTTCIGGVSEAHVYLDPDEPGGYFLEEMLPGTTVEEMLARVQYFPSDLQQRVQAILREKAKDGTDPPARGAGDPRAVPRLLPRLDVPRRVKGVGRRGKGKDLFSRTAALRPVRTSAYSSLPHLSSPLMHLGIVQMSMSTDRAGQPAARRRRTSAPAAEQGATVVCLPELFLSRYFCQTEDADRSRSPRPSPARRRRPSRRSRPSSTS